MEGRDVCWPLCTATPRRCLLKYRRAVFRLGVPWRRRQVAIARRFRVVLVEPALDDNGAVRVSLDRAERWHGVGVSVVVFVAEPGGHRGKVVVPPRLEVRSGTATARRFRWTFLLGLWRLLFLARRADVLVSGREVGVGLLQTVAAGWILRRPVAVTVQSRPDIAIQEFVGEQLRGVTTKALRRADLAVCVSTGMVPKLAEMGVRSDRLHTVSNGVDVERVVSARSRAPEVALPPGRFVIGCGRLHRQKGFDLLIQAHAMALRDGAPQHHLVLVGDGPERAPLEELAASLNAADTVMFTGFVADPHALVARAEAFVLSSRWEGYPLALAEALCCATPCIAFSCVSGPDEVLDFGRFGLLVPPEDAVLLASAVRRHLEDGQPLLERALAGAAEASTRFDAGRAARLHLELLHELRFSRRPVGAGRADRARACTPPQR